MICENSPNYNYAMRKVEVRELVDLFGSAREAFDKTGADEALALFFIHNPDRALTAGRVTPTQGYLREALEALMRNEKEAEQVREYTERVKSAAVAYNAKPTLTAIQRACKCGHAMASLMLADARGRGWVAKS